MNPPVKGISVFELEIWELVILTLNFISCKKELIHIGVCFNQREVLIF